MSTVEARIIAEYKRLSKLIKDLSFPNSDEDPGKHFEDELVKRDKKYTELLKAYTTITKVRFWLKEAHKWVFFWLVVVACIFCIIASCRIINKILAADDVTLIIDAIPALLAAFTALVSTVIAVPVTITKFLFNTNEDDNITTLIKHTQKHDSMGRTLLKERFLKNASHKQPKITVTSGDFITDITHD